MQTKQYMPLKPIKRGFKLWCLCDSKSGYLYKFDVYCGKSGPYNSGSTETMVSSLLHGLEHHNISVYTDNFYTSVSLAQSLLRNGIYLTGTMRSNRKDFCLLYSSPSSSVETMTRFFAVISAPTSGRIVAMYSC